MTDQSPPSRRRHHIWHIAKRTLAKSWDDSIFSESAQAAFWCALSLPPLLLGMLGSLAYIAPLFGPETLPMIQEQLISTASRFFSRTWSTRSSRRPSRDIVRGARGEVVSIGFVISLWAGSSAISAFVDSVVEAHDQTPLRHPVRQRFFALGLYVVMLVWRSRPRRSSRSGRARSPSAFPTAGTTSAFGYYPVLFLALVVAVTVLYRVSLPKPLPSHRLVIGAVLATVVFLIATFGLRIYLTWITSTGYTYGALATPIAFLLFAFFLGFAIMIGAELNAAIQEEWPAPATHAKRFRWWLEERRPRDSSRSTANSAPRRQKPAADRGGQGRRRYFLSCS